MQNVVLAYIEKDEKYLMLLRNKRKVDMNKGKYVGIGGHIEAGETKEEAMIREIKEETNLNVLHYTYRGLIYFNNGNIEDEMNMYLFIVDDFNGELKECDEGSLYWVNKRDIFNLNLWEGDKYFLEPLMNSNDIINLKMYYDGDRLINVIK